MSMRKLSDFDKGRIADALGVPVSHPALLQIKRATQKFWTLHDRESRYEDIALKDNKLRFTYQRHGRRGAPQKKAARRYVAALIGIYQQTTGRKITRIVDWDTGKDKRHPFLAVCLKAAGSSYPPRIIREVLEDKI